MSHPKIAQQITFFYTQDLVQTADFYENVMGFRLILDQGPCRIYRVNADAYLGFCTKEDILINHGNVIFTLVTSEVDEWYRFLLGRGVQFEKPPALNQKFQIYHCFLRDPNGYLIEIQRFLDAEWNHLSTSS